MKNSFTMPDAAFTMAEILLSLTIIGVVAAITLPSLTGNINERTWNTQRKALYARFSQALALMPSLNGYGILKSETVTSTDESGNEVEGTSITDTAAEAFITEGLAKVLKINNVCDSEHLADCGIPATLTPLNGTSAISLENIKTLTSFNDRFQASYSGYPRYFQLDTKAAAFETQNGESILIYYNPNCVSSLGETETHFVQPKMCANFVYDLNGSKGPNTVGKDIGFITALYPTDPVIVAPMPLTHNAEGATQIDAGKKCLAQDSDSRLPNIEELASMLFNNTLLEIGTSDHYWSNSIISTNEAWSQSFYAGRAYPLPRNTSCHVRCIKR